MDKFNGLILSLSRSVCVMNAKDFIIIQITLRNMLEEVKHVSKPDNFPRHVLIFFSNT